ncbi:olfactory receptor 5F1-like [Hyperolius riggenbachi]|uniref:olfactory receptor 5F1-like n=1 Tax=Hyperolius riggenbachi TaxID=752182 RepID=UPI0035A351CA
MNSTSEIVFTLTGLTDKTELGILLFVIFLLLYITMVMGNVGIMTLIIVDRHLHKPMYFFLSNLSMVDLIFSSAVTPKMLRDLLCETRTISFVGCALQMCFFMSFATTEGLLLAVMAYDRYVAICMPLLYGILMNYVLCRQMVVAAYFGGLMNGLVHTTLVFHLNFCKSKIIDHFFCDIPPLYKLSCSNIFINVAVLVLFGGFLAVSSFLLIIISYTKIVLAILKIQSSQGRYKTFNTCASHMTAVSIFYGTAFFTYLRPSTSFGQQQDLLTSVFYSVLIPVLNPLIYSFRNAEVKYAVHNIIAKKITRHFA